MSKKAKKIGLIIIVLLIVIAATLMLIPAIIGMNYGYDSAQMEIKIRENCNCKSVTKDNTYSPSESFPETITSGKPINKFKFILTDCHYNSLTDLSQDILVMVKMRTYVPIKILC